MRHQRPHLAAAFVEGRFAAENQVPVEFFNSPGHKVRFDPRIGLIERIRPEGGSL